MTIDMICNNKGVIVRHGKKSFLFSYGTMILTREYYGGACRCYRCFRNESLLTNTTLRHIREYMCVNHVTRKQVMSLPYKEVK